MRRNDFRLRLGAIEHILLPLLLMASNGTLAQVAPPPSSLGGPALPPAAGASAPTSPPRGSGPSSSGTDPRGARPLPSPRFNTPSGALKWGSSTAATEPGLAASTRTPSPRTPAVPAGAGTGSDNAIIIVGGKAGAAVKTTNVRSEVRAREQARAAQLNEQKTSIAALMQTLRAGPLAPVGPMGTRSITIDDPGMKRKYVPGSVASVSNTPSFSRAIYDISNAASGKGVLTVTPGGLYAIGGRGFGAQAGRMFLRVNVNQTLGFQITHWQDDLIIAMLDPVINGVSDIANGELNVVPVNGKAIALARVKFEAAREVVTLRLIPRGYTKVGPALNGNAPNYYSPFESAKGWVGFQAPRSTLLVYRSMDGEDRFFEPGSDEFGFDWLAPGFEPYSFDFYHARLESRSDNCNTAPGSMSTKGAYDAAWLGDKIRVNWGVQRCHFSPAANTPAIDTNWSVYALNVNVTGPRGVNPVKPGATHR